MNEDPYAVALKNALTEIKNICPDVSHSFIFTKDGAIVAGDAETDEETMEKMINSFQSVAEKADTVGNLKALHVDAKKGKVILSSVNDMYLTLATSKNVDTNYLNSVVRVIIPTVLKLLETITPTPFQATPSKELVTPPKELVTPSEQPVTPSEQIVTPSKQLVVDTLSGFFVGDSVRIDTELLEEWTKLLDKKSVKQVEIEAFGGKATQCKVKEINDSKLKGKGMIRIPEKVCNTLEVKKGELVKVKPAST